MKTNFSTFNRPPRNGKTALVFSGNGSQWPGMAQALYCSNPCFRAAVNKVDRLSQPSLGWSVAEAFKKDPETWSLEKALFVQPMLFAIQVGMLSYCVEKGLAFHGTVGHSIGEVPALWAAGGLTLKEAVRVVVARSQTEERVFGTGGMAAVSYDPVELKRILQDYPSLEIACLNSTDSFTLSGEVRELKALCERLAPTTFLALLLEIPYPYHSAGMQGLREVLLDKLQDSHAKPMVRAFYSSVNGSLLEDQRPDSEYWWRNLRKPVQFASAIKAMLDDGYRQFIEISPFPILNWYIEAMAQEKHLEVKTFSVLEKGEGMPEFDRRIQSILNSI